MVLFGPAKEKREIDADMETDLMMLFDIRKFLFRVSTVLGDVFRQVLPLRPRSRSGAGEQPESRKGVRKGRSGAGDAGDVP